MGEPCAKLWVGNLSYKISKEDMDSMFREHGHIVDIKILDKGPHVYAFVEYDKIEDAKEAYQKLQGSELRGSAMKIEYANGRKRSSHREREGRDRGGDRFRKRDSYKRRSRSRSHDKHKKKNKSHRRRSSSSESQRKQRKSGKAKAPKDSGSDQLSNS